MSAARSAQLAGLGVLFFLGGCTAVPPGELEEDERWQDVMRTGHLGGRGALAVDAPRLTRPAELELAEAAPVHVDEDDRSSFWPGELPPAFSSELRTILRKNTGYEVRLWGGEEADPDAPPADYRLELVVTRYRLELLKTGLASSLAALWFCGLPHLASFYNAPDEHYRCEYEAELTLRREAGGDLLRSRTIRGTKRLALTDGQRGWSLYSYWPEQALSWLPQHDPVQAWQAYAPSIIAAVEPHARRALLIELMRFLREDPPPGAEAPPTGFALFVGVGAAGGEGGTEFVERDARALAAWLARDRPRDARRVLLGEDATGDAVQAGLWESAGQVRAGQRLLLYLAGRAEGSDAVQLADRALPLRALLEPLRAARRRGAFVLAIVDASLLGGSRGTEADGAERETTLARLGAELEGVYLCLGASGPAGALENAARRHGAFTESLLRGLAGAADGDRRGGVTLGELEEFLARDLPAEQQVPVLLGPDGRGDVVALAEE